jgi:hypothetical protein
MFQLPGRLCVDHRLAILADATADAFFALDPHANSLITLGANQHDIRNMHRPFKLDDTRVHGASLGLNLALVLLTHVDSLDNHTANIGQDFDNLATLAPVLFPAADHFDSIAFPNLGIHGLAPTSQL